MRKLKPRKRLVTTHIFEGVSLERLMLVLTWAGTIPLKKGERTRLACCPSRLGEDFNPLISSHRTVKAKRVIRVFGQTPNTTRQRRVLSFSTVSLAETAGSLANLEYKAVDLRRFYLGVAQAAALSALY